MHRIFLLCAVALPAAALAEDVFEVTPKPQPYQVVDIDYWGTITEVDSGSRRVGESITGSMRIDLRYAPPDRQSQWPEAEYTWVPRCLRNCPEEIDAPSQFVTTRGAPLEFGGNSYDRVLVFDESLPPLPFDQLSVEDWETPSPGGGSSNLRIVLNARSSVVDFIRGDGLLQQFDLRPAEAGGDTAAGGTWNAFVNNVSTGFRFAIDRIRAKPKVCRP